MVVQEVIENRGKPLKRGVHLALHPEGESLDARMAPMAEYESNGSHMEKHESA